MRKGTFCKNLFLKDRKGQFYLVIIPEDFVVDLKYLKQTLGAYRNFSFGKEEDLDRLLGTMPGCVTPYGLSHDAECEVRVIIDATLSEPHTLLNFHPLVPWLTTLITFSDLNTFVTHSGHQIEVTNLIE